MDNLLKALELAEGQGHCAYTQNQKTEPKCIIGQLFILEGGSMKDLKNAYGNIRSSYQSLKPVQKVLFKKYDKVLLQQIQSAWDESLFPPNKARQAADKILRILG